LVVWSHLGKTSTANWAINNSSIEEETMVNRQAALLIDWANARAADFRKVVRQAQSLGTLEFAAAYGVWGRLETRDGEKLFLALGG
jgi:aminoglycoside/choline kinase family phosphotransferase